MNLTFDELRKIKHLLPEGSISRIAETLQLDAQTVRNYFGGDHYEDGHSAGIHVQPGPEGGIVNIEDTRILDLAHQILSEGPRSEN